MSRLILPGTMRENFGRDRSGWRCVRTLHKFDNKILRHEFGIPVHKRKATWAELLTAIHEGAPFDLDEAEGNLLTYGGASNLWEYAEGNGTGTAAMTLTYLNNANAYIGVGDSATAAAATDTDLIGASKDRQPMEATYPIHTDGTGAGADDVQYRAVWGSSEGNFAWQEWGVFNASTGQRMINRKVESLGTKGSGATWTLTVTLSLVD